MILGIEKLVTGADIIQLDPNGILINFRSIVFRVLLRIVHDKRTHVPDSTAVVPGILLRAVILDKPKINQLDHIGPGLVFVVPFDESQIRRLDVPMHQAIVVQVF